jgi:quercetin dioxygenase-like cupin family protein
MDDGYSIVQPTDVPPEQFQTCETAVRKLTEPLGCTELRINQVVVDPGEVTTPHTHEGQEEVFVALTAGQIAIEGTVHDVPEGGIVRVHPDVERLEGAEQAVDLVFEAVLRRLLPETPLVDIEVAEQEETVRAGAAAVVDE